MSMESYEATSLLFAKIKNLDPENASKIMGYLLIQDFGEKDLMRLAFSPDIVLQSMILKVKNHLVLSSNSSSTPSSTSPLNPIARPTNSNPFSKSSPRIMPNNGFDFNTNPPSPSSNSFLSLSGFSNNLISPKSNPLLSYDNIRTGSAPIPPFLHQRNSNGDASSSSTELIDDRQLSEYLSSLTESSAEDLMDPRLKLRQEVQKWAHSINNGDAHFHRRSYSASDVSFGCEDGGFGTGYKPCLYFARGFCKNGNNCKFVHGGFADSMDSPVGSPNKIDRVFESHDELMRLEAAALQQRVAAQLLGGLSSPSQYNKYMNFLLQQQNNSPQRASTATFTLEEEFHKLGLCRNERSDFLAMAAVEKRNSASRQIYLTFPADSTFKDEDVSEYFSKFGPVQSVRIPFQQKRMFGFVTFVYPETVKLILAKGNPHFICDSRVLVKPYKEKGKIPDKRQQHQLERGDLSPCLSPSSLDCRDPYDLRLGARMLHSTQEMLYRRKLEEQAELQQAIELNERRLMNLQLPDLNDRTHHHRHSLSVGSPLPTEADTHINQTTLLSDCVNQEVAESLLIDGHVDPQVNPVFIHTSNSGGKSKGEGSESEQHDVDKSLEQALPENLFASPTKSVAELHADFSEVGHTTAFSINSSKNNQPLPATSASDIASL